MVKEYRMNKTILSVCVLLTGMLLNSCAAASYEGFAIPEQSGSTLIPVAEYTRELDLANSAPEEPTLKEVSSADGICKIKKKEHYYDVTLNMEQGDHRAVGAAYAETILAICPDFAESFEPYLYENINMAFPETNDLSFSSLTDRVRTLKDSLETDYREEVEGFAEKIAGDMHGFHQDGILSYEEALTLQMIPDALRGTACSAVSLDGSRTVSGERLSARILEWLEGSADQISQIQTVLHYKKGNRSVTNVGALGMLDVVTGFNDCGVLVGCLDVGGAENFGFAYQNKTCYSFALRHVLENCETAREAGEYLVGHCRNFTYSNNIFISDRNDVFCAEDAAVKELGEPKLRTPETPLRPDYQVTADGAFFAVNCYSSEGSPDQAAFDQHNIIRWKRFDEWFGGDELFTAGSFKSRLACETPECYDHFLNVVGANADAFHVLVIDYATGEVQVSFYRPNDQGGIPEYIKIAQI